MMPTMKREQFEEMSFTEFIEWAYENIDDVTSEEALIAFAKEKLDDDNLGFALHILNAIYESEDTEEGYYRYDYSMGTLETPTPISCKEDLEDLIDFDEEEE